MKSFLAALLLCVATPVLAAQTSAVEVVVGGGHGSGVYLGHGYVLTAAHVTEGAAEVQVVSQDGNSWSAKVKWEMKAADYALLKMTDKSEIPAAKLSCQAPKSGAPIKIEGWPDGLGFVTVQGTLVGTTPGIQGPWGNAWIMVAPIYFGNSGGPVYQEGEVVGLAVGMLRDGNGLSLMIPVKDICDELPPVLGLPHG